MKEKRRLSRVCSLPVGERSRVRDPRSISLPTRRVWLCVRAGHALGSSQRYLERAFHARLRHAADAYLAWRRRLRCVMSTPHPQVHSLIRQPSRAGRGVATSRPCGCCSSYRPQLGSQGRWGHRGCAGGCGRGRHLGRCNRRMDLRGERPRNRQRRRVTYHHADTTRATYTCARRTWRAGED